MAEFVFETNGRSANEGAKAPWDNVSTLLSDLQSNSIHLGKLQASGNFLLTHSEEMQPLRLSDRKMLDELSSDAGALALAVLSRNSLRSLTGAAGTLPFIARLGVPLAVSALSKSLLAEGSLHGNDLARGAFLYGAFFAGGELSAMVRTSSRTIWGVKNCGRKEFKNLISERKEQLENLLQSQIADGHQKLAAYRELKLLNNDAGKIHNSYPWLTSADKPERLYQSLELRVFDRAKASDPATGIPNLKRDIDKSKEGLTTFLSERFAAASNLRVLELGASGSISVPVALSGRMETYTAIEASRLNAAVQKQFLAGKKHIMIDSSKCTQIIADQCRLPIKSGSQDIVVSNCNPIFSGDPLEYSLAIKEMERVLKPGGELFLQPWSFLRKPSAFNLDGKIIFESWAVDKPVQLEALLSKFEIKDWRPYQNYSESYLLVLKKRH